MELRIVKQFVEEMANNSSTNAKKDILRKYAGDVFLVKVLQYTYHPFTQFFVTSKLLEKKADLVADVAYGSIFELLDALIARTVTGHDAIAAVNAYIALDPEVKDIVYQIIDRNLKTRATDTIINEVIPGCIPVFEVQLAEKYDEFMEKVKNAAAKAKPGKKPKYVLDLINEVYFASTKLDGCRCVGIVNGAGECSFVSRSGKPFNTLAKVKAEIEALGLRNVVFDGEICLRTADDTDDFQGVMKEIQRKDHTIENPLYYIFDVMTLPTFLNPDDSTNVTFSVRLDVLKSIFHDSSHTYTAVLPQKRVSSLEEIERMKVEAINSGREGLMLKRDTKYQQGRTNDILKVKLFFDAEYEVLSTENEIQRIVEDGKEVEKLLMKNVQIMHKGSIVDVGSGWDLAERKEYLEHPENIVGKIITVQYQMESVDQHGKPSLRFPTVKVVHGKERTI